MFWGHGFEPHVEPDEVVGLILDFFSHMNLGHTHEYKEYDYLNHDSIPLFSIVWCYDVYL